MPTHSLRNLTGISGSRLEADGDGLLFDPSIREGLAQMEGQADVAPLEALAALRLAAKQAHTAMERWTDSHGLSESRLRVLMALYHTPDHRRPLGELAEILNVVPRTVTDVIDVLERDGLITRVPDPTDRRSVHARLSGAGLERVEAIKRDAIDQQTALFAGFSRDEIARLRHLCLLLVQQLNRSQRGS
jgi:DNA-binding MarR family transcriptional regulator